MKLMRMARLSTMLWVLFYWLGKGILGQYQTFGSQDLH
jgi:hypothetical protein